MCQLSRRSAGEFWQISAKSHLPAPPGHLPGPLVKHLYPAAACPHFLNPFLSQDIPAIHSLQNLQPFQKNAALFLTILKQLTCLTWMMKKDCSLFRFNRFSPGTPHNSHGETFKWPRGAYLSMDNVKLKQQHVKYLVTVPS